MMTSGQCIIGAAMNWSVCCPSERVSPSFTTKESIGEWKIFEEVWEHLCCLGATDRLQLGVVLEGVGYECGMVRFKMMGYEIVRLSPLEGCLQIGTPDIGLTLVDSIENGYFLVCDDVGVITDTLRNDVLAFEKIEIEVIDADRNCLWIHLGI